MIPSVRKETLTYLDVAVPSIGIDCAIAAVTVGYLLYTGFNPSVVAANCGAVAFNSSLLTEIRRKMFTYLVEDLQTRGGESVGRHVGTIYNNCKNNPERELLTASQLTQLHIN